LKSSHTAVEKDQLIELARICLLRHQDGTGVNGCPGHGEEGDEDLTEQLLLSSKYDLVANICHDSLLSQGVNIVTEAKANNGLRASASSSSSTAETSVLQNGIYRIHVQNKVGLPPSLSFPPLFLSLIPSLGMMTGNLAVV
jgi:hypothetical protein